jgi:lipase ATG15
MRYPTCRLANIQGGFGENSTMLDFAFLAGLPYKTDEIINSELQSWFTDTIVEDDVERVNEFRAREDKDNAAVEFRLINFPEKSLALIMIRGTQNNWDMLADSQLWSAAALMQVVRLILPVGELWTPILDRKLFGANYATVFFDVNAHPFPSHFIVCLQNL